MPPETSTKLLSTGVKKVVTEQCEKLLITVCHCASTPRDNVCDMPAKGIAGSATSATAAKDGRAGPTAAVDGVYSIGAVVSMLHVPAGTLRTWEERYGVVSPERTLGGHRLYSRSQIEQLRFVTAEIASGSTAADAHRALEQRMVERTGREQPAEGRPRILILIAERDEYSAELIEFLLRTEGFAVEVTLDADEAKHKFELVRPDLVIVEFLLGGGEGEALLRWLKQNGAKRALVISELDVADRALRADADAFLRKPVGHLQLVSVVKDLLGFSAMVGEQE
jgi:DNA-binding transcriptional MerR regulator